MPDLAQLRISVESNADKAVRDLNNLVTAANKAEQAISKISAKGSSAANGFVNSGKGLSVWTNELKRSQSVASAWSQETVNSLDRVHKEIVAMRADFNGLGKSMASTQNTFNTFNQASRSVSQSNKQVNDSAKLLGGTINSLKTAFIGLVGTYSAVQIIKMADQYNQLRAQIQNVIPKAEDANGVFKEIIKVSNETGISIQGVANAFVRMAVPLQGLGKTSSEIVQFQKALLQLGSIGGSSAEEIKNASIQLSQGLGAGALRGEELNSVLEGMRPLAAAIAKELKLPEGTAGLKKVAEQGKITGKVIYDAVAHSAKETQAAFDALPPSVERSTNKMINSFQVLIGSINDATGATEGIARAFDWVSGVIDNLSKMSGVLATIGDNLRGIWASNVQANFGPKQLQANIGWAKETRELATAGKEANRQLEDAHINADKLGISFDKYLTKVRASGKTLQQFNLDQDRKNAIVKPAPVVDKDAARLAKYTEKIQAELEQSQALYTAKRQGDAVYEKEAIRIEAETKIKEANIKATAGQRAALVSLVIATEQNKKALEAAATINQQGRDLADLKEEADYIKDGPATQAKVLDLRKLEYEIVSKTASLDDYRAKKLGEEMRTRGVEIIAQKQRNDLQAKFLKGAQELKDLQEQTAAAKIGPVAQQNILDFQGARNYAQGLTGYNNQEAASRSGAGAAYAKAEAQGLQQAKEKRTAAYEQETTAIAKNVEWNNRLAASYGLTKEAQLKEIDAVEQAKRLFQGLPSTQSEIDSERLKNIKAQTGALTDQTIETQSLIDAQKQGAIYDSALQTFRFKALDDAKAELDIRHQLFEAKIQEGTVEAETFRTEYENNRARNLVLEQTAARQQRIIDLNKQVGDTFADAFLTAIQGGQSLKQTLAQLASQLARIALQETVGKGISSLIQRGLGFAANAFSGSAGAASNGAATAIALLGNAFADGAAFSGGNVVPFARGGSVVSSPTSFPMSGGRTGLMGEAGEEAIMPLKRMPNGSLGVRATGGSSGGYSDNRVININVASGAGSGDSEKDKTLAMAVMKEFKNIDKRIDARIIYNQRPGNSLSKSGSV